MDAARAVRSAAEGSDVARPFLGGWYALAPLLALAAHRDLWPPDEPRYAEVAREAWESGSLLVLHLCGEVYPDKPPLVYWLAGALGRASGWSELALRVPSILATAGSAWLCARIARTWLGPVAAAWAPLVFLTFALVAWTGARLQLDPVLSFFVLAAVERAWSGSGSTRDALLAGVWCGLAALAKGPVAWLHVGLALASTQLVPRAARARIGWLPRGWALFALAAITPVAAWAALASIAEPALARPLFLGQHVGRVVDPRASHHGPPWEHLLELPLYLLPWTPLVLLGIAATWRSRGDARGGDAPAAAWLRIAVWLVLTVVVFSAIPPKRELYLLPVYPAAAWLAAAAFARAIERGRLPVLVGAGIPILLLAAALAAAVGAYSVGIAAPYADGVIAPAITLAACAGAALAFLRRGNLARWADALAIGWVAASVVAALTLVPRVDAAKSARALAEIVARRPEKPAAIPCIGVQPEAYRFYGRVPAVRGTVRDLADRAASPGPRPFLALVDERTWERLPESSRAGLELVERRRVGSREVLLVARR